MRLASSPTRKNTKSHIGRAKKIFVDINNNDDDPEKEEKTLKFPTIRVSIQMVDELTQFAQDSLEDEELVIPLNPVWRLFKKNYSSTSSRKTLEYFLSKCFCINTPFVESHLIY